MERIPVRLFDKLEPAEIFHQLLEHRWFLSEEAEEDISLEEALDSYIAEVLVDAPDEVNISRSTAERVDQWAVDDTLDTI